MSTSDASTSESTGSDLTLDCLTKINIDEKGVPIFIVQTSNSPIVIGRANTNQISIDSENVSRHHAILVKYENQWQIKDAKSTNGVFINNNPITSQSFYKLFRGDVISLGPPKQSIFKFVLNSHDALSLPEVYFKIPCHISANGVVTDVPSGSQDNKTPLDILKEYKEQYQTLISKKNGDDGDNTSVEIAEMLLINKQPQLIKDDYVTKLISIAKNSEESAKELDVMRINQKLSIDKEELAKQVKILREKLKVETGNQVTLTQKLEVLNKEIDRLEANKEEIRSVLLKKIERLQMEKRDSELRAKHEVAEALNAQLAMQKEFENQKFLINNEKLEAEQSLLQQIEDLHKKLDSKDNQADMLKSELCAVNMNNEQALFDAHRQINEIMENEFICSICSELFVNAVTLSCTHTFCENCIISWEREKQGCPICRTVINYKVRCMNLDNFIDNMVMNFTPDEKSRREELKSTRQQRGAR